ncbi:uncharacterized protein LOC128557618 [Mercenaria mercenaria]|uniref:uncharacterized protein LOC128557618 n=1 Tax=Mercenaria mercenaria TaxID=6596 RepID=UPI00234ED766|nr:uncharacterized protein LOC128557618 [Mercenaria mercenaria]
MLRLRDFTNKTKDCDATIRVENKELFVSTAVLSIASPVFAEMFEQQPTKILELPGIEYNQFTEFLKCIYPDIMQDITETTAYWILPLAHKYKLHVLQEKCVNLIVKIIQRDHTKNAEQLYRHIKLSELYDVQEFEICVEMVSECKLHMMEEANKKYPILPNTNVTILKLALRKLEIAMEDAMVCELHINKDTLQTWIRRNLLDSSTQQGQTVQDLGIGYLKALRLINNHSLDDYLRHKTIRKLKSLEEYKSVEEYNLLPSDLKKSVEQFNSTKVWW